MMAELKCLICGATFKNYSYFSSHLRFDEHIKSKDYYDIYLKKPSEEMCPVCQENPNTFIDIRRGYTKCCSRGCSNSLSSGKGLKISKTKQEFSEEKRREIKDKRQSTCLKRFGAKSNLAISSCHSKDARQKATETRKKHIANNTIASHSIDKSWLTRKQNLANYCQENNCTLISCLIDTYGQGFLSLDLPKIYINKQNCAIANEYISTIKEYTQSNQYVNKSKAEQYILDRLNYPIDKILHDDRKTIKPKELDIYIPDLKLAIEYNGTYWHSTEVTHNLMAHRDKSIACHNLGVRLIHIFEFEDIDAQIELLNQLIAGKDNFEHNFTKNSLLDIPETDPYIIYTDGKHTLYSA